MCSKNGCPIKFDEIIRTVAEEKRFLKYNINKCQIKTAQSYLAQLYEVDIRGETKHGEEELNLFVKINYIGDETLIGMSVMGIYETELFAYTDLYKVITELQDEAMIPTLERYRMVKCFDGSTTDAIMLENMVSKGYTTLSRMDVVSLEFAEKSVREIAKMHALSFALEQKRPEYFERVLKNMKYPVNFGDQWSAYLKKMIETSIVHVDDDVKKQVERTYYELANKCQQFYTDEAVTRCICHGDINIANFMVKTHCEEITDVVLIDYQFLHYGCPVIDFIYFVFLSTDRKFRADHLSYLKDLYHETLSEFLEYFHMDVECVYPKKIFNDEFKEKLDFALLIGFTMLPLALATKGNAPDLTREFSKVNLQVSDVFIERQRGLIEEFIDWGYIV